MDSLWQKTARLPRFEPLQNDIRTDVLVIGGGLAGVLCAYRLQQAGIACVVIEANRVGGGVSGNTTAKITSQHGLVYDKLIRSSGMNYARLYRQANEEAISAYRELACKIPCDFEEQDAFVYSRDRADVIRNEYEAYKALGIVGEYVTQLSLPFRVAGAVKMPHQAQFHPLKLMAGLVKDLVIYENTPARRFDGRRIHTDHGVITASKIVVATHFPIFNKHGGYFLKLYQHRSYVLALEGAAAVQGMYVDERDTGLSFRRFGELLLLGGGGHRTGKDGGNWKELEDFARTHYPQATVRYRFATQDCMSLDGVPYIGQYGANTPDLYVATGFNKWGMTSSMAAATVLCDLIRGKNSVYTPLFSPSRSMLHKQLLLNAVETTTNLLLPKTPRCPHLGCALHWNRCEHSWDCACHGSRFSQNGTLLNTPATGDLEL